MSLQGHFGINDEEFQDLSKRFKNGPEIQIRLMQAIPAFDPHGTSIELNYISLMYYVDAKGDFSEPKDFNDYVAMAMFNSLSDSGKMEIMKYVQQLDEEDNGNQHNDSG